MSNAIIRVALETRLKNWADAQSPKLPVAFQNAPFTKPDNTPFLEAHLLPNITVNKTVDGKRKTYMGIFQVNCWAPSGKGMGQVEKIAQSVANIFPMLPKFGAVSIEKTPDVEQPVFDTSGWVIVPVVIHYRMETI